MKLTRKNKNKIMNMFMTKQFWEIDIINQEEPDLFIPKMTQ